MGVSMESKHHSADFTCGGFKRLRTKVAELTAPDIFRHYKKLDYAFYLYGKERENFFEEYNKKIEELDDKYQGEKSDILDFLYLSDCGGELDATHCRFIWKIIQDYNDDLCYGYPGLPNCAKFQDFKNMIKERMESGTGVKW